MIGFLITARAIAKRCLCPPESVDPLSPTSVSSPFSSFERIFLAFAISIAARTSSSVASWAPYLIFSRSELRKRTGSCPTSAIFW